MINFMMKNLNIEMAYIYIVYTSKTQVMMTSLTSVFSSSLRVQLLQVFLHQSLLKAIYTVCAKMQTKTSMYLLHMVLHVPTACIQVSTLCMFVCL